jgi:BCD family chlorophyll transporter-like MFS transporter
MMMLGILAGVFLGVWILDSYTPERLIGLFLAVAACVGALTVLAIAGQEHRTSARPASEAVPLRQGWHLLRSSKQARRFFLFLLTGILFLFLQQVVLEPYGGDVFGLDIRATTLFNAYQMVGVLAGMAFAGGWLARRIGNRRTAGLGLGLASISFLALAAAGWLGVPAWLAPAIGLMGLGMGLFNVGGLALMMGMAVRQLTGLYMGTWTLAQALGNGLASVGGGLLFALGHRVCRRSGRPVGNARLAQPHQPGQLSIRGRRRGRVPDGSRLTFCMWHRHGQGVTLRVRNHHAIGSIGDEGQPEDH